VSVTQDIRGNEGYLTAVVEMLPELHITMSPSGDMEIALHLVELEAAVYAAAVALRTP
jgi:hypothetical protein